MRVQQKMLQQGYLTIAVGDPKYVEMAYHLALSLKLNDPERPVVLLTDNKTHIPAKVKRVFHRIIPMPEREGYVGCLNKLRAFEYTPFDETIFIDADCLLTRPDMDRHWHKLRTASVNIAGDQVTSGRWYNFNIEDILQALNIRYMVKMNSGVFYFRKNKVAEGFFETTHQLYKNYSDILRCSHRTATQVADEPFMGAAFGVMGLQPITYTPEEGSIMVTTVSAKNCQCDPVSQLSRVDKPAGFEILNRFWAKSWVQHSPSIMHFVQLKPNAVYRGACKRLEQYFYFDVEETEVF